MLPGSALFCALADAAAVHRSGPWYVAAGAVALFAGSLLLCGLLVRAGGHLRRGPEGGIGWRALAGFFPIAIIALIALFLGRTHFAVGIVFGTSVGAMTSVIGLIALAEPVDAGPRRWSRLWPFALVASLIVFVAGFKGTLQWQDAVALLTEGIVVLGLWFDPERHAGGAAPLDPARPDAGAAMPQQNPRIGWQRVGLWAIGLLLVLALLWLASIMATRAIARIGQTAPPARGSGLAGAIIGLALVLPMTWGAWRGARYGQSWAPVTTQVSILLLNLCVLLPALILIPYAAAAAPQLSHFAGDALAYSEGMARPLDYPMPLWRIDNVVLLIASALLLPVSLGRWNLGREEGMVLIAGYFFYLTATLLSA